MARVLRPERAGRLFRWRAGLWPRAWTWRPVTSSTGWRVIVAAAGRSPAGPWWSSSLCIPIRLCGSWTLDQLAVPSDRVGWGLVVFFAILRRSRSPSLLPLGDLAASTRSFAQVGLRRLSTRLTCGCARRSASSCPPRRATLVRLTADPRARVFHRARCFAAGVAGHPPGASRTCSRRPRARC